MTPQKFILNCKDWRDLEKKLYQLNTREEKKYRGLIFEWLCVFYLQVEPRYKAAYKEVLHSSQFLNISKIKKILGYSYNKEEGVDAIAIRHDGKIDIVQAKFLDNSSKSLTKDHMESSIEVITGINAKPHIDTLLMCSNAKRLTNNKDIRERHPDIQFRTLLDGDFQTISKNDFDNIKRVIRGAATVYKRITPRKHQKKAISAIYKHFKTNNKGQLIHACGTGKTLTSYLAYKKINPKLTLFAVPSLQLINQTLLEWTKQSLAHKSPISPFVICSDKSNEKIGECEPGLWLQELGIRVSNEKNDLKKFLSSNRKNKVIFCTYQSGKILGNHLRELNKKIDLGFFDEAHNTVSSKFKNWSYLVSDENIKIKKRLFMTATPKKFSGNSDKYLSMNEKNYGKVVHSVTVKDAIEKYDLLNDYKIITRLVDGHEIKNLLKKNPFVIDDKRLPKEEELKLISSGITLNKAISKYKIKNIVSFHSRVNRAFAFQKGIHNILNDAELNSYHVNGKQSGTERYRILEEFSTNQPSLVTNAQCLSEGVNVPAIDAIIFVDPRTSKVNITQAIGRALRKGDKTKGKSHIIVPVVIEKDADDIEKIWQPILMVLRAMAEHDGRIIEYFKERAEGKKPQRDLFEFDTENLTFEIDLKELEKKLNIKAWERTRSLGWRPFAQAREWARTLNINSEEWRSFVKTKKRPLDVPAQPDAAYRAEWTNWPDFLGTESEKEKMEKFIKNYIKYSKGKTFPMPPDNHLLLGNITKGLLRSNKLKQLPKWKFELVEEKLIRNNIFDWDGSDAMRWKISFKAYKDWKEITNIDLPPKGTKFNNILIETWYQNQKVRYAEYMGTNIGKKVKPLNVWQIKKLKSISFLFEKKNDADWKKSFKKYKPLIIEYKGKIPSLEKKLTRWISKQRENYKKNKLDEHKIKKLEGIKFWSWGPHKDSKEFKLQKLIEYINKTKDANPKQTQKYNNVAIGSFLSRIRSGNVKLKNKEKILLEELGVNFEPTKTIGSVNYYD